MSVLKSDDEDNVSMKGKYGKKVGGIAVWCWDREGRKTQPLNLQPQKPHPTWERASECSSMIWPSSLLPAENLKAPVKIKA